MKYQQVSTEVRTGASANPSPALLEVLSPRQVNKNYSVNKGVLLPEAQIPS